MSDLGALLFARYAYPPNELGYCGPDGAALLLRADLPGEIARRARGFEGAWAYLCFLARTTGVSDPLDPAIVSAYWVGDALPDRQFPDLLPFLRSHFLSQRGGTWQSADGRAVPHHSFHVFEVYPWTELLRRTENPAAVTVLDRCRIRTGTVVSVAAETATVTSRPLTWDGATLAAGPPAEEQVTWSSGGRSLLKGVAPGDRVALHWDWLCDRITENQAARIETLEARQLSALFPKTVVPPV
ncbi:DUF6390 family protein [Paractinoplanes durhamensis]|uniref:Uncharacterized protein n=1 Tax=Paractinoplanes durhamensis TaxID=113563 RepID=A0ABQ3YYW3_9ACTN|nr:DUF6390 family protein [Actinoplanes durhamensis]GIE02724.1 hypothetical protein Adu01nite_40740 [Actinoplanes durhamensis]